MHVNQVSLCQRDPALMTQTIAEESFDFFQFMAENK